MNRFIDFEKQYQKFSKEHKLNSFERDRIKPRFLIIPSRIIPDYYGLSISSARELVNLDFLARYKRFLGYNVNFKTFYDDFSLETMFASTKSHMPVHSFIDENINTYKDEVAFLDISDDSKNAILTSDDDFTNYIDTFFIKLFEEGIVRREFKRLSYNDKKVFQESEYKVEFDDSYDLDGNHLQSVKRQVFSISIKDIKREIKSIINSLKIDEDKKNEIKKFFKYKNGYKVKFMSTQSEYLEFFVKDVSFITGLEFIAIKKDGVTRLEYAGYDVHSRITGRNIPVYYGSYFSEEIHPAFPSIYQEDYEVAKENGIVFDNVVTSISSNKVLVNSGFLNGYSLEEAKQQIIDLLERHDEIMEYDEMNLDEVIISAPYKFGIPIPLTNELKVSSIPLIYDVKHEVKMVNGMLADKSLVNDFFNNEFVNALRVNAAILKEDMGINDIIDFKDFKDDSKTIDILYEQDDNFVSFFSFQIVINALYKHYFSKYVDYDFKAIKYQLQTKDNVGKELSRENNNVVSISNIASQFGTTTLRIYFAVYKDYVFDTKKLNDLFIIISDLYEEMETINISMLDNLQEDANMFINNCNRYLDFSDYEKFAFEVYDYTKKVLVRKMISKKHFKEYLVYLSILTPSLANQLKELINLNDDVSYLDFPVL